MVVYLYVRYPPAKARGLSPRIGGQTMAYPLPKLTWRFAMTQILNCCNALLVTSSIYAHVYSGYQTSIVARLSNVCPVTHSSYNRQLPIRREERDWAFLHVSCNLLWHQGTSSSCSLQHLPDFHFCHFELFSSTPPFVSPTSRTPYHVYFSLRSRLLFHPLLRHPHCPRRHLINTRH